MVWFFTTGSWRRVDTCRALGEEVGGTIAPALSCAYPRGRATSWPPHKSSLRQSKRLMERRVSKSSA
jgi:hypothetical protein